MKKSVFALVLVFILVGCKAKKGLVEANASDDLATQKIIENHYDVKKDFQRHTFGRMQNTKTKINR